MFLALLGLSTLASLIVSLVLSIRLLRLWSRTRQLPELVIGLSFLSAGVLGYLATILGNPGAGGIDPELAQKITVVGISLISLGVSLNYLFVWQVFRPESRVARACFWIATILLAATVMPLGGGSITTQLDPVTLLGDAVRMSAGIWGATESLRYYAMMRKRLRLGLAEPAVTNRFLLWGFATLTTSLIFLATSAVVRHHFSPMEGALTPGLMVVASLGTIVVATMQWLVFLPPAFYRRRFAAPTA